MLTSVALYAFRNYRKEEVRLHPGVNLFLGANAQGKTNLLEAVYLAATGRSPRASVLAEMVMWEQAGGRVVLGFLEGDASHSVEVRLERAPSGGRTKRGVVVDERSTTPAALVGRIRVVLFHPEEMTLVRGSGEGRRRLISGLVSQWTAGHAAQLSRYGHLLEQRNQLLKRVAQELETEDSLTWWTEEIARVGGGIVADRQRCLAELGPLAADNYQRIAGGEQLEVRYQPSVAVKPGGDGAGAILAELRRRQREEIARGVTVAGPHRDDIEFSLDGIPAAAHASQGQQRTAILAFKLAEVELLGRDGGPPVLLLDDVMSELDAPRRAHLLELVEAAPQALITAAEEGYFPPGFVERVRTRRVVSGSLRP